MSSSRSDDVTKSGCVCRQLGNFGALKAFEVRCFREPVECLNGVYKESRRCFRGISWTFYRIAMEFASNFQVVSTHRGFNVVSRVFHLFLKGFKEVLKPLS